MRKLFYPCILILVAFSAPAAPQIPTREKIAEDKAKQAALVEQRLREQSWKMQQDCPSPEVADVTKNSQWNTLEVGVSLPLGEGLGEGQAYSRYTCQTSKIPRPL